MRQWLGMGFLALVVLASYFILVDVLTRPKPEAQFATQWEYSEHERLGEPLLVVPHEAFKNSEKERVPLIPARQ